jgi:predicted transcriptional regulator
MENAIILSLKPEFAELIEKKEKTFEFRKYKPQKPVNKLYIYVTSPVCELKYVIDTENPIEYPNKVTEKGIGNADFNNGLKVSKFAYPIKHLYKIDKPISLNDLREKFDLQPPQGYVYAATYNKLFDFINENCSVQMQY